MMSTAASAVPEFSLAMLVIAALIAIVAGALMGAALSAVWAMIENNGPTVTPTIEREGAVVSRIRPAATVAERRRELEQRGETHSVRV